MARRMQIKTRHIVLSILFVAWILSTMDRMVMSVAVPYIATEYKLSPLASGAVMSVFFAGYSIAHIPGGILADLYGVRRIATLAMLWWSAFTALTGAAMNFAQLVAVRFTFGLGEGIFPASAFKTIAVWFPKEERATANALMLASNPLGVGLGPLVVVGIMSFWGWQAVFYSLLVPGMLVAFLFWAFVRNRPAESKLISSEEVNEIGVDQEESASIQRPREIFRRILKEPNVVKYFLVLFFFDIAYWGFTTWLPTYLVKARGFSMVQMGLAASLPFFAGIAGCVAGGWLSDNCFPQNRRVPIVASEIMSAFFLYMTFSATSIITLVLAQTLAGFFLNLFFSAFWAFPMNTVPRNLMGVASGFINMAGQVAAFMAPSIVGYLVEADGGEYLLAFSLLISALFVSSAVVGTLPRQAIRPPEEQKSCHAN